MKDLNISDFPPHLQNTICDMARSLMTAVVVFRDEFGGRTYKVRIDLGPLKIEIIDSDPKSLDVLKLATNENTKELLFFSSEYLEVNSQN